MKDILLDCDRTWRSLGVPPESREELAAELRDDLAAAAADGRSQEAFIGSDVRRFAGDWARERGVTRIRPLLGPVAAAAATGCGLGWLWASYFLYASWTRHLLGFGTLPLPESRLEPLGLALSDGSRGWLGLALPTVVLVWAVLALLRDPLRTRTAVWLLVLSPAWFAVAVVASRAVTRLVPEQGQFGPSALCLCAVAVLSAVAVRWVLVRRESRLEGH